MAVDQVCGAFSELSEARFTDSSSPDLEASEYNRRAGGDCTHHEIAMGQPCRTRDGNQREQ